MTIRESRPEYDSTIGFMIEYRKAHAGAEPGDPAKAADAILYIAGLDEPPLRLLLGSDAVNLVELSDRARMEADLKWRELSLSTDFDHQDGAKGRAWEQIVAAHSAQ